MGFFNFLNTAFESNAGSTTRVYSMLTSNPNSISGQNNTLTSTSSQIQEELYKFLDKYSFVEKILDQIKSVISDVFAKSSLRVTINLKNKKFERYGIECDNLLAEIQFFTTMKTDLRDLLYYGNYGYKIDFKDRRMKRLSDGFKVLTEDTYCADRKLIIQNWVDKDERIKDKKARYALLPIQFDPQKVKEITELEAYLEDEAAKVPNGVVNIDALRKDYLKEHPNSDKVIKHTVYRGKGALDTEMNNLLVLYTKELLYDLLGLKDTCKPDILTARVMDDKTNEADITKAINDIEALVNMGSLTQSDPGAQTFFTIQNMIAGVQSYLQNGIKVVPEINNFTSISTLNLPDLTGKRRQLKEEIDELRQRILSNLGLEDQPARNKWDAINNNSKFLTVVESFVGCISNLAKDIVYEYLGNTYPKDNIPYDAIQLDLDTTDIIFNQYALTRTRVLTDKVDSISRILGMIDSFAMNQFVDQQKLPKYIMKLIKDLDPTAEDFIKVIPQEQPQSDIGGEVPVEGEEAGEVTGAEEATADELEGESIETEEV